MSVLDRIESEQKKHEVNFRSGDQVRVHVRIIEGDKERTQIFEGVVISTRGSGTRASFTVRKISYGVGVERIFPVQSPSVQKVEVVSSGKVRRAKLYYLRERAGKAARLEERDGLLTESEGGAAAPEAAVAAAPADTGATAES